MVNTMKTKKLFHIKIASLIALGALALVGFTQAIGKNSISRLQSHPLILDVPIAFLTFPGFSGHFGRSPGKM